MNTKNVLSLGCALVMTTAPFHVNALTAEVGLNACTEAMVNDLSTESGTPMGFRMDVNYTGRGRMKKLEIFHLDARHPGTNKIVGRYDCVVTNRAKVVELVPLPLSADDAAIRAGITE
jgi:hypothetical protein